MRRTPTILVREERQVLAVEAGEFRKFDHVHSALA